MAGETPVVRSCGACSACCFAIRVITEPTDKHQVVKEPHHRCAHQAVRSERGCKIYDERPECCRVFTCMWVHGFGRGSDRPDKLGIIVEPVNRQLPDLALVTEAFVGGADGRRAREVIERIAVQVGNVFVLRTDGTAQVVETVVDDPRTKTRWRKLERRKLPLAGEKVDG
jgi:hypothetical protein